MKRVLAALYKEMEKKKMKENIIIRLERENEYHEVENLVRESSRIWRRKNFRDRFSKM